jgi:transglutaminase-like putative cysteine protease
MSKPDLRTFDRPGTVMDGATMSDYGRPGRFVDAGHGSIRDWARRLTDGIADPREKALRIYYAVRDEIRYDPYGSPMRPEAYIASNVLAAGHGFCINKAGLMAAALRAASIPARLGYADVRNHMTTRKLAERMGTDIFFFHGYVDVWLDGQWIKATPAFNRELTEKFRLAPLDWDGRTDSIYHPFDLEGRRHMEYLAYRGVYADLPFETIKACFDMHYPRLHAADGASAIDGDFAAEGAAETAQG